ncbi:MAG: GNAT family N-acetyltransferase [Clostridia bacterium]|nr:GNAT family N-acetyltransferase [Clostridia bacterium]
MKAYIARIEGDIRIKCVPFQERFFEEYKRIYNECFYEMRKCLDIKPYCFLSDYAQIKDKCKDIFLLIDNDILVGSVACYGNEIDDLFVAKQFQRQGIGRQLLLWGMKYIRDKNDCPIHLHVAAWNKNAVELYKSVGFTITNTEIIKK